MPAADAATSPLLARLPAPRLRLLRDSASASDGRRSASGAANLIYRHVRIGPSAPTADFVRIVRGSSALDGFHAEFHASSHGDSHAAPSQKRRNGALEREAWIHVGLPGVFQADSRIEMRDKHAHARGRELGPFAMRQFDCPPIGLIPERPLTSARVRRRPLLGGGPAIPFDAHLPDCRFALASPGTPTASPVA
jgi:hypothetical protein